MKYTGIVRRLDSLGRIVIPREYRRMHNIRESDPLEIIAMDNGEILIRKIDLSASLMCVGEAVMSHLNDSTGLNVMLSDNEKFLSASGGSNSSYINTVLSIKIQSLLAERRGYNGKASEMMLTGDYVCIQPIFGEDCFGGLYFFSNNPISAEHEKLLKLVARIMGNMMQKY